MEHRGNSFNKLLFTFSQRLQQEIDDYIVQAKERSYETMVNFGRQGLSIAATAAVSAAVKVTYKNCQTQTQMSINTQ